MRRISALLIVMMAFAGAAVPPAVATELAQARQPQAIDGEVTRVNKDTQKITIRHGPMPHIDMPAMTMVYALKDPAMLDQVKVGSKIRFIGDKIDGQFTVLSIDSVR
jgi:Cu(I)/Ag(I) efflux system periplasmic protein CusF